MKRFNSYALKETVTAIKFKDKIKDILLSDPGEGDIIDTGGIEGRWQQFQENMHRVAHEVIPQTRSPRKS